MGEPVWQQTWQSATRGGWPSSWDSHMIPSSNVIITCLHLPPDIRGFQVCWEFSAFSISIELLLAVQTNSKGGAAPCARQFYTDLASRPDTGEMSDGRWEGWRSRKEGEKEPNCGLCCHSEEYGWL